MYKLRNKSYMFPYTLHKLHTSVRHCGGVVTQSAEPICCTISTTILKRDLGTGELCDKIGLVGVSAKWINVTASPSHHDQAIPLLSPLLFMHVGHPLFKKSLSRLYTYIITSLCA